MGTETAWRMRGDVMEACSCNTTCPCNFGSDPTRVPCEAIVAWRIEEGNYGNVRLDGLNAVLYVNIPGNMWDGGLTAGIYFDQRATPKQFQALGAVFSGQAGGWPGIMSTLFAQLLPPKQVPISYEKVDGEYYINVPGLLKVETEQVPNAMPGAPPLDPKVDNLAVPFYTGPASVRRSRILKLTDPDMNFEHSGRSSLIGHFEYSGP